jgi:glycosidase
MRLSLASAVLFLSLLAGMGASPATAQGALDVTFRFIPDLTQPPISPVVRAYLPGQFNDWGPNTAGAIAVDAPSRMALVEALNEYRYTHALQIGQSYQYKVHYHRNASGTEWTWISDPLNPITVGPDANSVVQITDPMAFQPAREQNDQGLTYAVSAGLFGTEPFTGVSYRINAGEFIEGLEHFDAETGIFRVELPEPVESPIYFEIQATDAQNRTVSASSGIIPPVVIDLARPAGLRNGITYVDDTTVRFSLFAPYKQFVHLIGDFNDWTAGDEYVLYRDAQDADNVWWWIEVDGLTAGQEYAFQYLVDGVLRIADPYSEKILDPSHDSFISSTTYPGLMPYPAGETSGIVGVIHPGRIPYEWTSTGYVRPAYEDLVVYELLIRDFIGARNFQTLRDTLDYLERLGVNAIGLMPVAEFDGNLSWGYNPTFHLALDKAYGTRLAFKQFIDEAHSRGIAVIVDVVYNHAHDRSPIVQLYGPNSQNPFLTVPASHPYNVFLQLNHDSPFIHDYIDQANERWLTEFRVDGFRYDLTKGFMTSGPVDGYNAQRIANLKRMADRFWEVDDSGYIILEHFAANTEEQELSQYGRNLGFPGMLMWHNMNRAYSQSAMGYLNDSGMSSNLSNTYPPNRGMPLDGLLTYMESHDEQWLMYRNRAFGPQIEGYDVRSLETALERQKLVGTFFFTVPGPRQLWQFGELGFGWGISGEECLKPGDGSNGECPSFAPGRTANKPLPWNSPRQYHLDPDRQRLYKTWAALINLRRSHPVFTSPETVVNLRVGQGVPDRRIRLALDDVKVVIVGNFGLTPLAVDPLFHETGTWYEFFSDTALEVSDVNAPILLAPGEARLYATVDFPSPEPGIYAVSGEEGPAGAAAFRLETPFPNPTATEATVVFSLDQVADVRLDVFDLLGRRVARLVEGTLPAGDHSARLDAASLPSGLYVVRLSAGDRIATSRLTILR